MYERRVKKPSWGRIYGPREEIVEEIDTSGVVWGGEICVSRFGNYV